jgi:hypothetical protein
MPLNATIGRVSWPIVAIGQAYLDFFLVSSSSTRTKRSRVDAKAPVFNKGITYQMKEKGLIKVSIQFLGGVNYKNHIWLSGFSIAFVIVCNLKS